MTRFSARVVSGAGRGRTIGTPTMNLDLNDIPQIEEGIYAGWAKLEGAWHMAAIHFGPRPVFNDSLSFEVHLLDTAVQHAPERLEIALADYLRPVRDFPSPTDLMAQIAKDVDQARGMLEAHGSPDA